MSARYWLIAFIRAIVAIAVGIVITFNEEHSAAFGLVVFGAFAIAAGLLSGASALAVSGAARVIFVVDGVVGLAAGVVALTALGTGLGILLYVVSVWAAITGATELYLGLRDRTRVASARDWTLVGALTCALAVVFAFIPADQRLVVGLIGAYAIVIGVYLAVAALSLRWSEKHPEAAA